jgi:hypothetical protein
MQLKENLIIYQCYISIVEHTVNTLDRWEASVLMSTPEDDPAP